MEDAMLETLAFAVVMLALAAPGLIVSAMSYRAPLAAAELPQPQGRPVAQ
jgi:hypothetical protein